MKTKYARYDLEKELIDFLIWYDKPRIKDCEDNAREVIHDYLLNQLTKSRE